MSCDSVETRMRIRPRESSLSRPFAAASSSPLIAGVSDSSVARSSPERRSRMACGHASRRTQQVIDQRCVRPAFCQRHFDYGHPRSRSVICRRCPELVLLRAPDGSCRCMARFTTPHALRMCRPLILFSRRAFFFPRRRPSFHPLTLPSPRAAYPLYLLACASAAFAFERRPPLTGVRRRLRARGRDHPPT
jgi:hypothetical protein